MKHFDNLGGGSSLRCGAGFGAGSGSEFSADRGANGERSLLPELVQPGHKTVRPSGPLAGEGTPQDCDTARALRSVMTELEIQLADQVPRSRRGAARVSCNRKQAVSADCGREIYLGRNENREEALAIQRAREHRLSLPSWRSRTTNKIRTSLQRV